MDMQSQRLFISTLTKNSSLLRTVGMPKRQLAKSNFELSLQYLVRVAGLVGKAIFMGIPLTLQHFSQQHLYLKNLSKFPYDGTSHLILNGF